MRIGKKYETQIKNFSSLSLMQLADFIIPMMTFPYLVRILGPEKYGLLGFATSFVTYFTILTEFGFAFSAVQKISLILKDEQKVREYFWTVITVKFLFFICGLIVFSFIVLNVNLFYKNLPIYYILYLSTLGLVIFPRWYFQAIEKMKYIVKINIIVKSIWLLSVFYLIRNNDDIIVLVIINSLAQIVIGLWGLRIAIIKLNNNYYLPSFKQILKVIEDGKYLFFSRISASIYTNSNVFLLGLFCNNKIVGYFIAIDKIRMALQGVMGNISQSIFPFLNRKFNGSVVYIKKFITNYLLKSAIVLLIISSLLFIFTNEIILLLLGEEYKSSVIIFRLMIFVPLIVWIGTNFGVHIMISLGFDKDFFKISMYASIIHFILLVILTKYFSAIGVASSIVITELYITSNQFFFLKRKKIL